MAFCAITDQDRKSFGFLVIKKAEADLSQLKDLKAFSKSIYDFLVSKNASQEKAVALLTLLPELITHHSNFSPENRKIYRSTKISIDDLYDLEDTHFRDYDKLTDFIGLGVLAPQSGVTKEQQDLLNVIDKLPTATFNAAKQRMVNGKVLNVRVSDVATAGFKTPQDDSTESAALVHGNTSDAIAKDVFNGKEVNYEDHKDRIEESAFNEMVSQLKAVKDKYQGWAFRSGVTLTHDGLSLGGETDLIGIDPKGGIHIFDYKTGRVRMNDAYFNKKPKLGIDGEIEGISKRMQYSTQGYIYAKMLSELLGKEVSPNVTIIAIPIVYDQTNPAGKITKVTPFSEHAFSADDIRPEYKDKSLKEILAAHEELVKNAFTATPEEIKPKRQKKDFGRPQKEKLDRIARIQERAASSEELKKEVDDLIRIFGPEAMIRVSDVVNANLFGQFTLDGITLFKNASVGTGYHEGWHRFTQLYLSRPQKTALYDSLRKEGFTFTTRDNRTLNSADASYLDLEEHLAEEFAKYALDPKGYTALNKPARNLFEKIWDFLKKYFSGPSKFDYFQQLYEGNLSSYSPSVNNAMWGSLNSQVTAGGEEIISNERFPLYKRTMDALIAKELQEQKKSMTAFRHSKVLQKGVLNNVRVELIDRYSDDDELTDEQNEEFEAIISNYPQFINAYLKVSNYESLKGFTIDDDVFTSSVDELSAIERITEENDQVEDVDELNDDDDSKPDRELFDRGGNETSAYAGAEDEVKDFFSTIPKLKADGTPELNELGYQENHKQYDIFYKTKKMLEGAFTLEEMLSRLHSEDNHRRFPELKIIAERLEDILNNTTEQNKVRRIQNEVFIQAFTHAMELPHINNMQVTVNYRALGKKKRGITSTYKKLFRSIALKIIKNWGKNFKDRRGKQSMTVRQNSDMLDINRKENAVYISSSGKVLLNPFLDYSIMFPKNDKAGIKGFFDLLGFNLNEKIYSDRDAMKLLSDTKIALTAQLSKVGEESLLGMVDVLEEISGEELDAAGVRRVLNSLSTDALDDLAPQFFISDPVNYFSERKTLHITKHVIPALKFEFEKISAFEELYGDLVSSGSFSIEGKTKYPFYIPSQLSLVTRFLNQANSQQHLQGNPALDPINPLTKPWMKRSLFMKNLFDITDKTLEKKVDKAGNPIEIIVEDISSYKEINEDGSVTEMASASLSKVDKLFFDMLTVVNTGAVELPRAETSPTTFSMRLSAYGTQTHALRPAVMNNYVNDDFQGAIKEIFLSEVEKRSWYHENDEGNKLAGKFDVFEGILSKELKDRIWELSTHPTIPVRADNLFEEDFKDGISIRKQFEDETDAYFRKREADLKPTFDKLTTEQKSVLKDALGGNTDPAKETAASKNQYAESRALKLLIGTKFLLDAEYRNLLFGDYNFYKNPFKRGKSVVNTKTPMIVDSLRNQRLNDLQFQTLHSVATGKEKAPFKDFSTIRSGIMTDFEIPSSYIAKNDEDNVMLQDLVNFFTATGIITKENREAKIQELKDNITSKYEKINVADGQGIVGLDFYRNFAIVTKIWDAETHEKEYERQIAIYRRNNDRYDGLSDGAKDKARQKDEELIAGGPYAYFNPLKISYTGPQKSNGPLSPVFDKFSVRPILPETAVKGTRDAELLDKMLAGDIDYLKFESGTKAAKNPAATFTWINKDNLKDFSVEMGEAQELYSTYLGHQLNTDAMKKETIFSSQFRKIVYDVMFTPAVLANPEAFQFFSKQYDTFINTVKEAIALEEKELFNLLGVEEKNGEYQIANFESFAKYLNEEATKRDLPINTRKYLQFNKDTGKFTYPLDFAFNRSDITNLLSGLMDDRLRRLKLNGTQSIQVSSAGFEKQQHLFKKPTAEQLKQYGTNGLHYYHLLYDKKGNVTGTSTMGIKVGLTQNFKPLLELSHPDGKKIKTDNKEESLKRLNEALANKEWKAEHGHKMTIVGYRIPVQNNNFIDRMEIMEFLPESVGSIIIPPVELVVKSGSDFDIDKMNLLLAHLTKDGQVSARGAKTIDQINDALRKITFNISDYQSAQREFKDLMKDSDANISKLIALQRKVRQTLIMALDYENASKLMDSIDAAPDVSDDNLDDYMEKAPDLNKTLIDFYTVDREIEKLKQQYHVAEQGLDKNFESLVNQKKQLKGAIGNEIVENLSTTMASAYYYPLFVSPSTASMIDDIANNLVATRKGIERKEGENLFDTERTPEENSRYSTNLDTFENFLGKRKDLGGFAIQRTWSSILSKLNFTLNKNFTNEKEEEVDYLHPAHSKSRQGFGDKRRAHTHVRAKCNRHSCP
jgi:hypothetical protein